MKRIAITLVVFLVLGAVVNVGVAWGCAVRLQHDWYTFSTQGGDSHRYYDDWKWGNETEHLGWQLRIEKRFGCTRCWANYAGSSPVDATTAPDGVFPSWTQLHHLPMLAPAGGMTFFPFLDEAYGWPRPALWLTWYQSTSTQLDTSVPGSWKVSGFYLPVRQILPGCLINTLFYGAILWALWSAPFATRRLIRKRRGRCVRCGYDLRHAEHDVCPECGGRP